MLLHLVSPERWGKSRPRVCHLGRKMRAQVLKSCDKDGCLGTVLASPLSSSGCGSSPSNRSPGNNAERSTWAVGWESGSVATGVVRTMRGAVLFLSPVISVGRDPGHLDLT